MEKILITGMSGGLANLVAAQLAKNYEIIGVDFRSYQNVWPYPGEFLQLDYTKRAFADIFQKHKFKIVLHLGRIGNPRENFYKRYNLNVLGTANILNLCAKYHVETVFIFSTFHVYGAHQFNPANIDEGSPLRAGQIFPEIIDAVELDNLATSYLWKNRSIRTIVFRPCNVIGPNIKNTMSNLLRNKYVPYLMGFDPMHQFIYETDLTQAITLALKNEQVFGVFNVVGGDSIPLKQAIKMAGKTGIPVPHAVAYPIFNNLSHFGFGFPSHLLDYFRYPVIISDKKFRDSTQYKNEVSIEDALRNLHSHK